MCPSPEPVTGHMCLMSEWSGRQADRQVGGRGGGRADMRLAQRGARIPQCPHPGPGQ